MIFQFEGGFSLAAPDADVADLAWSPDGHRIVALAATARQATVFLVPEGTRIASVSNLSGGASTITWIDDAQVILPLRSGANGLLTVWDHLNGGFEEISESEDGQTVAGPVIGCFVDRSASLLACNRVVQHGSGQDGEVWVYDLRRRRVRSRLPLATTRLAFDPTGNYLAAIGQSGKVLIQEINSAQTILEFEANNNRVKELGWSPDGTTIATGTMSQGYGRIRETGNYGPLHDEHILQLWDAATGKRRAAADVAAGGGLESMEFSRDGRYLLTVTSDRCCRVWDGRTLAMLQVVAEDLGPTSAVARFNPDASRILVAKKSTAEALLYRRR